MNSSDVVHCLHHKAQCYQHHWFTEDPLKSSKRSSDSDRADTHAHVHVPFLLSGNTMFGLQVPKSSVCLSRSNIPRLSESCIFFLILSFRTERYGWEPGPDHSSQTQQRAITRFASTFCSWCLIRVTSSTPLRNRFTQSLRFLCVRGDFCRQMLPGCFEKQSDVTEA